MTHQQRTWHKSSYSDGGGGNCVEVAEGPTTHLRDTQHRALAEMNLPAHEWSAFLTTLTR
ncbi:DUF397 domain-containing protein [Nocardiopsis alba]|uniref:DUF397 domain-containing protein n=2 Tax=Nocardiopsis alba TaxID=53437 RepID=A0ABV5DNU3_9ACTN|nr:DUF397 domain-containing protein [Nocardiopsis alba]AFR08549.1 hypothetical protein B005_4190 [Nocardiopsis alba ATCC BAA-2165]